MKIVSEEKAGYATGNGLYPNTFQMHNFYVDELMHLLTAEEFKVLTFAVREILGWKDKREERRARIAIRVFSQGYGSSHKIMNYGTGISAGTIKNCLDALVQFGVLIKYDTTKDGTEYELVFDKGRIDILGLTARLDSKKETYRRQTHKARKRTVRHGGVPDNTPEGGVDSTLGGVPDSTNETNETEKPISAFAEKSNPLTEEPQPNPVCKVHGKPRGLSGRCVDCDWDAMPTANDGAPAKLTAEAVDPRRAELQYVKQAAIEIEHVLRPESARATAKSETAARRAYNKLHLPLDALLEYCKYAQNGGGEKYRGGEINGKKPTPFWVTDDAQEWHAERSIAKSTKRMVYDEYGNPVEVAA